MFRAVHAEALKRGLDHDALHDMCRQTYGVRSMGELTEEQLTRIYKGWTNRGLKRKTALPRKGPDPAADTEMISAEDLESLALVFTGLGWGPETQRAFIRRQLQGRTELRTRGDFRRVFFGARALGRKKGAA